MKFNFEEIIEKIKESSVESSIYVGCDSYTRGDKINYVTAIVIHYDSCRGGKCFFDVTPEPRFESGNKVSMRKKLLKEVELAVQTSLEIIEHVGQRPFQVHLDVNPDKRWASSVVIKEAIAWATSQGLDVKVKPEAFAASSIADNYGRVCG